MASKSSLKKTTVLFCFASFLLARGIALSSDKNTAAALSHYIVASVYDRQGELQKAIPEYKAALKADFENTDIHVGLASTYIKDNNIPKAIEELGLAVKFDPEAVEPHALLAILYSVQNKTEDANREYEIALQNASKLEPKNPDIYKTLGVIYLQQKKYQSALDMYRIILELSPGDAQAHFYIADIYEQLHNRPAAERELKKSLELAPDYADALNYLGYLYIEENRNLGAAETMINKALKIEPDNGAYLDSLGWLYFKKGKTKEAVRLLDRASILLEDPVIYDHLGDVNFSLRDNQKAILNWHKSLKLDPSQENVKKKIEACNTPTPRSKN
ncbi:MAG: tetratricopeptide repeat protein [Candidatus Omnitrophica bacterium]|nr:tetratricopeptide repeat protein [Candidatus Omnitrophota bacterium]